MDNHYFDSEAEDGSDGSEAEEEEEPRWKPAREVAVAKSDSTTCKRFAAGLIEQMISLPHWEPEEVAKTVFLLKVLHSSLGSVVRHSST